MSFSTVAIMRNPSFRLAHRCLNLTKLKCPCGILFSNFKQIPKPSTRIQTLYTSCILYDNDSNKPIDVAKENGKGTEKEGKLKQTGQLAKVFAEYGTTAVVFHTTISLTSLGISYMAVSSGIDVVGLMQKLNLITEASTQATVAGGATTFVIAYACHKVFMPLRIFATVTCTPLIVKKLRQIGLLKIPAKK
ncbi:protein FAM210B, mitochondrial-like [Hydractinia symbiolongicarpus]|uniref:protein FAM210B, mitochondrial-like n=1 Tax=Hydractinia symbiolongicarpus TaxID=13093 RepID=UPI0025518F4A|nr:protein FAM210B, mitochondrial-like [Hydractinia symbiolongicarpus]XP_057291921.1 protein FAM210B, mitochondrial-like [Hydractinia symbiolongicarpus]